MMVPAGHAGLSTKITCTLVSHLGLATVNWVFVRWVTPWMLSVELGRPARSSIASMPLTSVKTWVILRFLLLVPSQVIQAVCVMPLVDAASRDTAVTTLPPIALRAPIDRSTSPLSSDRMWLWARSLRSTAA